MPFLPAVILAIAILVGAGGCVGPRRAAYISVGTLSASVATLMDVWGEEAELGHTTPALDTQILRYYKQFQLVAGKAKIVQKGIYAGTQTEDAMLPLLEELSKNRRAIGDLIFSFISPEKKTQLQNLP